MLCDYAQIYAQRLVAIGAGTTFALSPSQSPPFLINLWIGAVLTVPWEQLGVLHRFTIDLVDATSVDAHGAQPMKYESRVFEADLKVDPPTLSQPGDDVPVPVAIPLVRTVPGLGPWAASFQLAGQEKQRLRFRVKPGVQLTFLQPTNRAAEPPRN